MSILFVKPIDRNERIGGTDVAGIMGLSQYKDREAVMLDKLGLGPPFHGNKYTESGIMMEPVARKWYEKQTGEQVIDPVEEAEKDLLPGHVFRSKEYPFLVGSPDGLVRDTKRYTVENHKDGLLVSGIKWGWEGKTAHYFSKKKWDGLEHKMPEEYFIQVQFYMMISGLDRWDLTVLHLATADRETHILEACPFVHAEMMEAILPFREEWKERKKKLERKKK